MTPEYAAFLEDQRRAWQEFKGALRYVCPSGYDQDRWEMARRRWVNNEHMKVIAADYGVTTATIRYHTERIQRRWIRRNCFDRQHLATHLS